VDRPSDAGAVTADLAGPSTVFGKVRGGVSGDRSGRHSAWSAGQFQG
ncbi:uncharacterized protein METZ01_LOCUS259365, partial [marine metagenome]